VLLTQNATKSLKQPPNGVASVLKTINMVIQSHHSPSSSSAPKVVEELSEHVVVQFHDRIVKHSGFQTMLVNGDTNSRQGRKIR